MVTSYVTIHSRFLCKKLVLVTCVLMISVGSVCWSETMSPHEYFVFGERRADSDRKNKLFYAYNDLALPLIANVQTKLQEELVKAYFRQDIRHQRAYLAAFVSGYHDEMLKIKGNAIITRSPLIDTLVESITRYAGDHNGKIPVFRNMEDLFGQLHNDYVGIDPYAGTRIEYGVNKHISGRQGRLLS